MTCATCDSTDRTVAVGEDKTVKITVYESDAEDAAEQDLSGFRLILVVAVSDTTEAIVTLDTDVGVTEGAIQNQVALPGQVWFFLTNALTSDLAVGTYDMEVWLDDGTGTHERVLDTTLTVDSAITVTW